MSFRPPGEVSQADLLKKGYAIDGNSAVCSVTYDDENTTVENLRFAEIEIMSWLESLGYKVQFR